MPAPAPRGGKRMASAYRKSEGDGTMAQRFLVLWLIALLGRAGFALAADLPDCSRALTLGLHEHGLLYSADTDSGIGKLQDERRVIYATGLAPLYETLLSNHIQGMIIEPFDYPMLQEGKIREATTIVEFNDPAIPHGLIMSRKSLPLEEQEKWRRIVDQMLADGTLYKIYEQYFDADVAQAIINY